MLHDKAETQVSQVMVDSAAPAGSSHHINFVGLDELLTYLFMGILKSAYHNGGTVPPQHEYGLSDVLFL